MNVLTVLGIMFLFQLMTFGAFDIIKNIIKVINEAFNKDRSERLLKGVRK